MLHLGHAFSALTAHDAARAAGGRFLLRIEDIDEGRCRPEYAQAILDDLAWLGVHWDEEPLRQSARLSTYADALADVAARGLVYRCFKTRRDIAEASAAAPHGPEAAFFRGGPDPDEAARLARGEPFAWRLSLDAARAELGAGYAALAFTDETGLVQARPERLGDVVLARKDTPTSYHLACVIDDAAQGVTHVIRGEDLREAAHLHALLQALLGLPRPTYRHHRLILGPDGKRLAKRDRAATLQALRLSGVTPAQVRALVGLPPAPD